MKSLWPLIMGFCAVVCALALRPALSARAEGSLSLASPVMFAPVPDELPGCVFLMESMPIPENGWLSLCWLDPSAPISTTVTEVNLKLQTDHPDAEQLDIRLGRPILSPTYFSIEENQPDGIYRFSELDDFDGGFSQGYWILEVRDGSKDEVVGNLNSLSLAFRYQPLEEVAQGRLLYGAKPTARRIAEESVVVFGGTDNLAEGGGTDDVSDSDAAWLDEEVLMEAWVPDESYQGEDAAAQPNSLAEEEEISLRLVTQTFEGDFPTTPGWRLETNLDQELERYWEEDDLKASSPSHSAWPARGGADGIEPTSSTLYPAGMDTWMIYGPFDLSNAASAEVIFRLWRHIEAHYDSLFFGYSNDGVQFDGWNWDGRRGVGRLELPERRYSAIPRAVGG